MILMINTKITFISDCHEARLYIYICLNLIKGTSRNFKQQSHLRLVQYLTILVFFFFLMIFSVFRKASVSHMKEQVSRLAKPAVVQYVTVFRLIFAKRVKH